LPVDCANEYALNVALSYSVIVVLYNTALH
jgi:hypothetical protein